MLLLAAPWMQPSLARHWIIIVLAVLFGFAGLANAVATRGRHLGSAWLPTSRLRLPPTNGLERRSVERKDKAALQMRTAYGAG